jgi:hypothetical protein
MARPCNCFQVAGPFFTIVVLSKRSPIVEGSALIQAGKVCRFNYLRLAPELPLSDASCDCDEEPDAEDH